MNYGDPRLPVRFWNRVIPVPFGGCWIWLGAIVDGGYGQVRRTALDEHRRDAPHRWTFEIANGPIPADLQIDHRCRVKCCCNPTHLEAVTLLVNVQRWAATITRCKHGHEYTPENTIRSSQGRRRCRTCHNAVMRGRSRAKRQEQAC